MTAGSKTTQEAQAVRDDEQAEADGIDDAPMVRVLRSAAGLGMPKAAAARSVFELASVEVRQRRSAAKGREPANHGYAARMATGDGVTRVSGSAYPARWTAQDEERERQRRQRQTPPKPGKGARTKSAKLRGLLGEGE